MIADGVVPKNVEQGYILRRLMRRSIREFYKMGYEQPVIAQIAQMYIAKFENVYESVKNNKEKIVAEFNKEEELFGKTLKVGLKQMEKLNDISGKDAFDLFQTYGFPLEMVEEEAKKRGLTVNIAEFSEEFAKHQNLSRTASEGKFKGGLADTSEETTALHSATHIMLAGLRKVLGNHVHQAGSNITVERLRFDFTHPQKVTDEELKAVEKYVNDAIASGATMTLTEMKKEDAKASGTEGSFWEKYPDIVKVYTLADANGNVWSKELCG